MELGFQIRLEYPQFICKIKISCTSIHEQYEIKYRKFHEKTEAQKNAYLKDLNKKLSEMQQSIKEDIQNRKEAFRVKVKDLMAKATEAAKFLSYKVCDMADMDYEECRTDKKN